MRRMFIIFCVLFLSFLILAAGCYQPGGPVPEEPHSPAERSYTQEQVDAAVVMEEQVIYSPELPQAYGAPEVCDTIHFLRFRLADGSTVHPENPDGVNLGSTDAVLVMLPGLIGGANSFEYLGRQLVYQAKMQDGANLEVWAVERRNNRLEDLSALNYLEEKLDSGDVTLDEALQAAIDYYYLGGELNGRTFDGWYTNEDVPYMAEFGLELNTVDLYTVIETMVPDPDMRRRKVFVGGHSMGGIMTSMFAAWDLDGNPETLGDAGFNNCAGIFGLDTIVTPLSEVLETYLSLLPEPLYNMVEDMTEGSYAELVKNLREDPASDRMLPIPMISAEVMTLLETLAVLADRAPDDECTIIDEVPYSGSVEMLLRILHSRDLQTFMDGIPRINDFRFTNEAMLGLFFDDSFEPISPIQSSMGFLGGGSVIEKQFPMSEPLRNIPLLSELLVLIMGQGDYFIANDAGPSAFELGEGPLYHWVNFDEVGDEEDPLYQDSAGEVTYTSKNNEVSDIQDVARSIYRGPTNLMEWYFPTRLIADFMAALFPYGVDYGLNFLHEDRIGELPRIELLGEQGVLNGGLFDLLLPYEYGFIEGYNHLDLLMASANTPGHRENEVIRPLIDFVLENAE